MGQNKPQNLTDRQSNNDTYTRLTTTPGRGGISWQDYADDPTFLNSKLTELEKLSNDPTKIPADRASAAGAVRIIRQVLAQKNPAPAFVATPAPTQQRDAQTGGTPVAQKKTANPEDQARTDRVQIAGDPGAQGPAPQTPASAAMQQGGAGQTAGSTMPSSSFEELRKRVLYSPDDPEMAVQNVLADMGIPGYNPIIRQTVLPAARGLGAAFDIQGALNGAFGQPGGANDIQGAFKNFLQQALSGAGGGIYGALGQGAQALQSPQLADALRGAFDMNRTGNTSTNPFLGALLPLLSDPSALLGLQQAMSTGLMGSGLAQGQRQLGELGAVRGYRQMGQEGDFLNSLFGS